jgi:hypothetical protein
LQSQKLREGSTQQFLIFKPVTKADFTEIDNARSSSRRHFRITYYKDPNLLIVKMPSLKHESAHFWFCTQFILKVVNMGISPFELCPVGATTYHDRISSKEGDSGYKPSSRKDGTDWPTIMIESGFSESLRHLRNDAKWWLTNSQGEVKIVVIISIQPVDKKLHLETWELTLPHEGRPVTRSTQAYTPNHPATQTTSISSAAPNNPATGTKSNSPAAPNDPAAQTTSNSLAVPNDPTTQTTSNGMVPTRTQEISIQAGGAVTGAPLILGFQNIFLRPAIAPESDIIFCKEDLEGWAEAFWEH